MSIMLRAGSGMLTNCATGRGLHLYRWTVCVDAKTGGKKARWHEWRKVI